jgi:hypothetical protein
MPRGRNQLAAEKKKVVVSAIMQERQAICTGMSQDELFRIHQLDIRFLHVAYRKSLIAFLRSLDKEEV